VRSLFLFLIFSVSAATACGQSYVSMSLCEFNRTPPAKLPHRVKIHASIFSALPHGVFLHDKNCNGREKYGPLIDFSYESDDPGLKLLEENLFNNGGNDGNFFAVVRHEKGRKRPYLWIDRIEDMHFDHPYITPAEASKPFPMPEDMPPLDLLKPSGK